MTTNFSRLLHREKLQISAVFFKSNNQFDVFRLLLPYERCQRGEDIKIRESRRTKSNSTSDESVDIKKESDNQSPSTSPPPTDVPNSPAVTSATSAVRILIYDSVNLSKFIALKLLLLHRGFVFHISLVKLNNYSILFFHLLFIYFFS